MGGVDELTRRALIDLRAAGWSTTDLGALLEVDPSTAWRQAVGVKPDRVAGADGKSYSPTVLRSLPKRCVWCRRKHNNPREYCSPECRRERRRYRAYVGHTRQV